MCAVPSSHNHTSPVHTIGARPGYRVRVTNVAGGAELASVLTQDCEVMIPNLPIGVNVNITVTARNAAGESQATAPVTASVP